MCLVVGAVDADHTFVYNGCKHLFGVIAMHMKYIGRTVEIIYQDRAGKITQRKIVVRSVQGDRISAYDVTHGSYRVFKIDSILAMQPVMSV